MSERAGVRFVDLSVVGSEADELTQLFRTVMTRGMYVLGPEVAAFEAELCAFHGCRRAVAVASGTDALILGMRAIGISPGDEVILPAMTAFPTAAAVVEAGATPVLVDIQAESPHLDLERTVAAITLRTKAVILVHLYGVSADSHRFRSELEPRGIQLIEDCAQAQGGRLLTGDSVGTAGVFGALSFYPTKNLAALGDAGAIITNSDAVAEAAISWRSHGERTTRYHHEVPARNSRLDDIQAVVLRNRLTRLADQITQRRIISARYERDLEPQLGYVAHGPAGAPHLAVVRTPRRNDLAAALSAGGIPTMVHYPTALTEQPGLQKFAVQTPSDNAKRWGAECLSLPLHLNLSDEQLGMITSAVNEWTTR